MTTDHLSRPRIPLALWLIIVFGVIAGTAATTVAIVAGRDAETRGDQAEENQTVALCVADRNAKVTRQAALSVLAVADVPEPRERLLRSSLDDLDRILERLLAAEEEGGRDVCAIAVDLKENNPP